MDELEQIIRDGIRREGRVTFADFMKMALYEPGRGYYTSGKQHIGADGDFYTSPATHPVFGALIAIQLEQMWRLLGSPSEFTVVEMGAGKGLLAQDILDYLPQISPTLAQTLSYITIEKANSSVRHGAISSSPNLGALSPVTGCFLSNELLDALPVHRVLMQGGHLLELYVTIEDDRFKEIADSPSTPLLSEQLRREEISLPENYIAEINLDIAPWMKSVAARLAKGFVLTIDYGHLAEELYAPSRRIGTLMTYHRHNCGSDPYVRIGQQDITTHVDFTAAILAGEANGLRTLGLTTQRHFLLGLGLNGFIDALAGCHLGYRDYTANRLAMLELVKPEGMGGFKVLVQSKGLPEVTSLDGLSAATARRPDLKAPLLGRAHMPLLDGKYPQYGDSGDTISPNDL